MGVAAVRNIRAPVVIELDVRIESRTRFVSNVRHRKLAAKMLKEKS